jgi:hypothetical protein
MRLLLEAQGLYLTVKRTSSHFVVALSIRTWGAVEKKVESVGAKYLFVIIRIRTIESRFYILNSGYRSQPSFFR